MNAMEALAAANDLYEELKDEKEEEDEEAEEGDLRDIIFHVPLKEKRNYTQFSDEGDLLFTTEYIQACLWVRNYCFHILSQSKLEFLFYLLILFYLVGFVISFLICSIIIVFHLILHCYVAAGTTGKRI